MEFDNYDYESQSFNNEIFELNTMINAFLGRDYID
jgi:hypothetical protein